MTIDEPLSTENLQILSGDRQEHEVSLWLSRAELLLGSQQQLNIKESPAAYIRSAESEESPSPNSHPHSALQRDYREHPASLSGTGTAFIRAQDSTADNEDNSKKDHRGPPSHYHGHSPEAL